MNDFKEPTEFIKRPKLSEHEMQQKLEEVRNGVATKMNKWADRVQVSMAFIPKIARTDGETWVENGKTYIQKQGYKEQLGRLQEIRMPWWCPKCTKPMNHRFDRKFYYLRGWCFDCNVEWEGQLRIEGKWEAFEARMIRENEKSFLRNKIQEQLDYVRTFKLPQAHYGDGRWEELATIDMFAAKFEEIEKDIEFCQNRLDVIQKEEEQEEANVKELVG